jgi:hypothetical protein
MGINAKYFRVKHAAHTGKGEGWDLEKWDFASPVNFHPDIVPRDAEFHVGYRDGDVQHWVYVRRAELSPGTCERCT